MPGHLIIEVFVGIDEEDRAGNQGSFHLPFFHKGAGEVDEGKGAGVGVAPAESEGLGSSVKVNPAAVNGVP